MPLQVKGQGTNTLSMIESNQILPGDKTRREATFYCPLCSHSRGGASGENFCDHTKYVLV